MKYIRYLIYLVLGSLTVIVSFYAIDLFFKIIGHHDSDSHINYELTFTMLLYPVIGSIIKYSNKEQINTYGMKNDYLKLESTYKSIISDNWKEEIKEIMNHLVYDARLFILEYENDNVLKYKTDEPIYDNKMKKVWITNNTIFVNVTTDENSQTTITVHKKKSITDFSNYDNEAVLRKIINKVEEGKIS
jgi:hypothetical protein